MLAASSRRAFYSPFLLAERLIPRNSYSFSSDEKVLNAATFALGRVTISILGALGLTYLSRQMVPWGMTANGVPRWIQAIVTFFLLDLVSYMRQWTNVVFDFLWRCHQIHHAATEFSVISLWGRFHFLDLVTVAVPPVIVAFIFGIRPDVYLYAFAIPNTLLGGVFAHTNLNYPGKHSKPWNLITNPSAHAIHHTVHGDRKNFGIGLLVWDMIFGTYEAPVKVDPSVFGTADPLIGRMGPWRQQLHPFRTFLGEKLAGRVGVDHGQAPSLEVLPNKTSDC